MSQSKSLSPGHLYLRRLFEFLLLCAIAYVLVRALIGYAAPQSLWKQTQAPVALETIKAPTTQNERFAFTLDPFHRGRVEVETAIGADAPETTLSLKLFGRRTGAKGSAILQTPDRVQGVFVVGDEIIPGVTLKSVDPDYIVLSRNGVLERLTFDRAAQSTLSVVQPDTGTAFASGESATSAPKALDQMTPSEILSLVSLKRIMERGKEGRVKGFEIRSLSDQITLTDYGLQDGDLITAIGNEDLTQGRPELRTLMSQLSNASSVTLTIVRDDTPLTLTLGRP